MRSGLLTKAPAALTSSFHLQANFHDLEPAKIREAASQLAEECTASQREEFKSLTVMADWSPEGTYRTLG